MDKHRRISEIDQQIKNLQQEKSNLQSDIEKEKTNLERYQSTYACQELLKKYSLFSEGTWKVLGEDPNCDLGGSHHQPNLGLFKGTLKKVLERAVDLPGFWQWGAGGTIEKVNEPVVTEL